MVPVLVAAPGHRLHGEVMLAGGPVLHLSTYPEKRTRPLTVHHVTSPRGTFRIAADTGDQAIIADALAALTDEDRRRIRIA